MDIKAMEKMLKMNRRPEQARCSECDDVRYVTRINDHLVRCDHCGNQIYKVEGC